MFERFTDQARAAVVAASEAARELRHDYIGTEHILLGLLRRPETQAARALAGLGVSEDTARRDVIEQVGTGHNAVTGHIPFTPRAKSTLEQSLSEALALQHPYIGTEHLLLALVSQPDARGAQVLADRVDDLLEVRAAVLDRLTAAPRTEEDRAVPEAEAGRRTMRIRAAGDLLTLEVTDPTLVELARAAATDLGDQVDEPGTIPGELPAAASLAAVWLALRDSLADIRHRAAGPA
ncbi:Clp protease N-terminal domain-containing protein [Mycobacterium branderi]|uniref:Clp R domain-containing protein n=1 Tax=Mycobacterium branderi TaxID=43348 RepID=A0A7I7WDU8_9MYCO|nr:Clp protease N-terminal domain-containing protein [Mycobacterium branderi]MCV7236223.1 hypothetical protein [Mycobacterium branderi]ORA35410.1 hypothetical protein BST20_17570 [Mycobacterium branderi]BBZ15102.1 hypothetical protein MBRA_52970 [Mycobacterium branderi]